MLLLCASDAETLLEAVHTPAGVHQLLLAGVERMTLGANFNLQFLLGGTGFPSFAAHAAYDCLLIIRMDLFLHANFTSFFLYGWQIHGWLPMSRRGNYNTVLLPMQGFLEISAGKTGNFSNFFPPYFN